MKVNDAINILKNSSGQHIYDVYVPSLKRNIGFKPITVGQQKTLAKMSLENEESFYKASVSLIQVLAQEKLDLSALNEIDRSAILAGIKKNNLVKSLVIDINCFNDECEVENYPHTIDLDKFIKILSDVEIKTIIDDHEIHDIKYKFELKYPSLEQIISFRDYTTKRKLDIQQKNISKKIIEKELKELEEMSDFESVSLFIFKVQINNQEVEDFEKLSHHDRLNFLDNLPTSILFSNTGIPEKISEYFVNGLSSCSYNIKCPKCNNEETLTIEHFFYS